MRPAKSPPRRRTRLEIQADNRERLLAAAGQVFRRDGYHGASLERIAATAGLTKGAVYSAFESKASLFLELLSRRAAERRGELAAIFTAAVSARDFVSEASRRFARQAVGERDWWTAVIEFMAVVGRDPALQRRYAVHHDASRDQIATAVTDWARRERRQLPLPPRRIATMVLAMSNGLTLEALLAPREVPVATYADAQAALFLGMFALTTDRAPP
ncbi:MAG TPA: TetR/AcrR family transcriptional regulator [Steroidobacteraceae bacterium]|nr:TetR/AcrR family transcriptional regulator [Steroidobacteraceae bacterium]